MIPCCQCNAMFLTVETAIQHVRHFHPIPRLTGYKCKLAACWRRFDSLNSYSAHLINHDRNNDFIAHVEGNRNNGINDVHFDGQNIDVENVPNNNNNGDGNNVLEAENVDDPVLEHVDNLTLEGMAELISNSALTFVSKLYSISTMNRTNVDLVVKYSSQLVQSIVGNLRSKNRELNGDHRLEPFLRIAESPFAELETEVRRFNALELSNAYIAPLSFDIDFVPGVVGNDRPVLNQIRLSGEYAPMRSVLKNFFEMPGVLETVLENYDRLMQTASPISNIVQGELWKNHVLPRYEGKTVLPLTGYFDDAEPDNVLGSHAGDHKLGTVYYNCPVIPQKYLATLKNIFVSSIFLSNDRDVLDGNRKVFHHVIQELKFLEDEGLDIVVNDVVTRIYFPLVVFLGDNLGLHSILGFAEGFTANFPCRLCRMHLNLVRRLINVPPHLIRTVQNYADDVATNSMPDTGVFEECVFNQLTSYHVITSAAVDIMHDVLEGVAKYGICQVLYYFIYVREYFSLEQLHLRISDFHYGPGEAGNKPPVCKITKNALMNDSLNLSAAEMLCFVRYLCQMIGNLIPEGDLVWDFYLCLREIVDLLFVLEFSPGYEDYVHALIQEHHEMYVNLFHENLKPKFHYMLHYRDMIRSVGPLVHLSSIRWEAKHRIIKQIARSTCSRINLPRTVMVKIMLEFGFRVLSRFGLQTEFDVGSILVVRKEFIDPQNMFPYFDIDVEDREKFNTATWVTVNGIYFKIGMILHVDYAEDLPVFAVLTNIIYDGVTEVGEPKIYFVGRHLSTISFNRHLYSYEVETDGNWMVIGIENLQSPHPLILRTLVNGTKTVCTRYSL